MKPKPKPAPKPKPRPKPKVLKRKPASKGKPRRNRGETAAPLKKRKPPPPLKPKRKPPPPPPPTVADLRERMRNLDKLKRQARAVAGAGTVPAAVPEPKRGAPRFTARPPQFS